MTDDPMLPDVVARALGEYREALAEHGMSWGEPPIAYVRSMSPSRFVDEETFFRAASERVRAEHPDATAAEHEERVRELDFDIVLRDALAEGPAGDPPEGLAVLRLTPGGHRLDVRPRTVLEPDGRTSASGQDARTPAGHGGPPVPVALLIDNGRETEAEVRAGGRAYRVAPGGARLVELDSATEVTAGGERVGLCGRIRLAPRARLRVRAGFPCRWSVWSADGQGWYPDGAPPRRDYHGLPYFHGDDLVLDVPAEPLTVRVARGMEYGFAETAVTPRGETLVESAPARLYDAAAKGWYGGDLHVHLNFAGDVVAAPATAAAMQYGEDLHVLNLLAANVSGPRVFDREALEHWAGEDLPWSDATHVARMGVEYRNDLLGHLHAFGLTAPPGRYHSGFAGTPDWPPTSAACEELRGLGAIVGYAHAFHSPVETPEDVIGTGRPACTARTAVVDAALGLVDTMEVLHFSSAEGSSAVYRRLLGAGNRLAAVAGTDSMLSFTRQRMEMVASPPGWERTYARVEGPLTAASYAEAVRRGRTFATTGPFVELTVDGHGPGDTIDRAPGDRVRVMVRVIGPEVERLSIRTADGVLAEGPPGELTAELAVGAPTYVVALAEGGPHPRSLFTGVFAHTSPVYVDVRGRRVARAEDIHWCLEWLELLERLIRDRARLDTKEQLDDHLRLIDEARRVHRTRLPT
ncbi:CehA/McbA family metallohydrolase [Sphaerisporangium sp. NBC_01403]|uniref:CehA/McbA family metallohydrolase n=1 Tax=Sphaerisporangium sp. NBC_01403 TaxID=2903599 RepID=UPI00324D0700